jgi:glycosyltransferase involved in cell wall biosynthesis
MKIALITPYADRPGGVESVNKILLDLLKNAGHTIELITSDNFKPNRLDSIMIKIFGLPYVTAKKFRLISSDYDVVIANGEFGWGIFHPHTINLFHGCYIGYRNYLKELWSFKQYLNLTRWAWIQHFGAKGKYVVTVSEFVKNILETDHIKVHQVISNCIDTDRFKPSKREKDKECLFVGSYSYYGKGFDVLEALADLGLEIDCVTNQQPSYQLGWIRNIDNSRMPAIYNRYKILVFPSRFEGMGMVPLEAMACGLPIVMSNVGLGPELKRIIPEFVAETHDASEFMEKIKHIEKNYQNYSQKAREYVETYHNFGTYEKQWLELVEKVSNA